MNDLPDFKKRGVDYALLEHGVTLPGKYYHSEEIYREEVEKIFSERWIVACREEEVPGQGDFVTVPVGDESILVVRDEEGEIRALFNVCRHRGTRICMEASGQFEKNIIRCPYHAWAYELNGNLAAAPLMNELKSFRKEEYPLHQAAVACWGGFVFINLSTNPVPFETEMAGLIGKFKDWHLPELRIAHHIPYELKCNWKLILQNYQECYHCPGVHPLLSRWTPFRNAVHDCQEGAVIGGYMEMTQKRGSMTIDGKAAGPPVCEVSGDNLSRVHYYSVYPNLLFSPHPDFVLYHRIRSVRVDLSLNDCYFLLHPEVIADRKKMTRFQSAIEFWDITNREDWQVCEQMQLGLKSRRFTEGRYSGQEDIVHALDRETLRALGHDR